MVDLRIVSEEQTPAPEEDATNAILRKLVEIVEEAFKDGLKQGELIMMHDQDNRLIVPDCPWGTPYATVRVLEAFKPKEEVEG